MHTSCLKGVPVIKEHKGALVHWSPPRSSEVFQVFVSKPDMDRNIFLSYLSRSLADRWGITAHFTTSFLHSSRFSAFRSSTFHLRPVHSLMLSSHRFLCLPLRLRPCTVPCRIVLPLSHLQDCPTRQDRNMRLHVMR